MNGFKFCDILNNSTFFTDLELSIVGMSSKLTPANAQILIQYIDWSAEQMMADPDFHGTMQRDTRFTADFSADTLKRGVCWNIAQGNQQWWKPFIRFDQDLTGKHGGRVLRTVDSNIALHFLNLDGKQTPESISNIQPKPRYQIAYVILVHMNLGNVATLIDALADPTAFIYLHVDLSAPESFHKEVRKLIKGRKHIALMPTSFTVSWGHVSLLWVELRAFFDLLDLIDFEYVINLSGSDYPLKSAKTIFNHLEKRPGSNWMWWANPPQWQYDQRLLNMYHCREFQGDSDKKCILTEQSHGYRTMDGLLQLFPHIYKTSQWVILHRSAVEYLRTSESGKLLLMHSEHTLIPDEMFFSTFFAASPFVDRTFRDPKRLMFWYGGSHPYDWTSENIDVIQEWASHFMWIRKVDLSKDPELKVALDNIRREDAMSNRTILKYRGGAGITPVD